MRAIFINTAINLLRKNTRYSGKTSRARFIAVYVKILLCFISAAYSPSMQANELSEHVLKSAFLFNFAGYTTWPDNYGDSFNLCIYGKDPFGQTIDATLEGKKVNNQLIALHRINHINHLNQCQLVFISFSEIKNLNTILDSLKNSPVLTVADHPHADQKGVSINMEILEDKVTFTVDLDSTRKAGLRLSSQLLRFAKRIYGEGQ
ncbi:MAG: YfiR family protein [Burkholderiales bacterium]|nr:YfiR family protein [Nitrosomonas sp.]MCP5275048.1 YfiR family protein [Burkholderiales bacterium]